MTRLAIQAMAAAAALLLVVLVAPYNVQAIQKIEIAAGDVRWELVAKEDNVSMDIFIVQGELDVWVMPMPKYADGLPKMNFTSGAPEPQWIEPDNMTDVVVYRNYTVNMTLHLVLEAPQEYKLSVVFDNRHPSMLDGADPNDTDLLDAAEAEVELTILHPKSNGESPGWNFWQLYAGMLFSTVVVVMAVYGVYITVRGKSRTYETDGPWDESDRALVRRRPWQRRKGPRAVGK